MRIKRLLFLLAALAISLPLFSQEYVGDSCTALLVGKVVPLKSHLAH